MANQKKKMAILSNTSAPAHVALKRLPKYNLRESMFAGGLVSSGEECAKFVRDVYCCSTGGGDDAKLKKALWITWKESETQNPLEYLSHIENGGEENAALGIAESVDDADFILLHGPEVWKRSRESPGDDLNDFKHSEDYSKIDPILDRSLERRLPLLCANPDLVVTLPDGSVGYMPGNIANRYAEKGGEVKHFGKPNPVHFRACLKNLGIEFDADAASIPGVAHVGDSLEHDVVGANSAGIDSIFVLGGIHARELGLVPTASESVGSAARDDRERQNESMVAKADLERILQSYFEQKGIWPTHVVSALSLGAASFGI